FAPGLNEQLRPPIGLSQEAVDTARDSFDSRFGKWGSSPAGVTQPPVSDRPGSFDGRFGNWGSVPPSTSGDSGSPVLRALEKFRRSAVLDGLASTSAQGAPATPASQAGVAGSGGVLGKFVWDRPITPAEVASSSGPMLRGPTAANLPIDESTYGDRSEDAPSARRSDTYPRRKVSSAFPGITPVDPDQPALKRAPIPGISSDKPIS